MRRFSSAQISATCHNACNDLKSTTGKVVMSASTKVQSQAHKPDLPVEVDGLLAELRVGRSRYKDGVLKMRTPITGETIGQVQETSASEAIAAIEAAHTAFRAWRLVPAPKRGELVRF
jgi:acyl-CoA reductase-like NAD-dependent aldehyde dehydrogenase